jgi:cell division protease FtsH
VDNTTKQLVAYHEVGHALCATLTEGHDPVQKVTLIPRGQAKGLTWFIPNDDPTLLTRKQLTARIIAGLGGRAAEEVVFGRAEVTTGAAGDLQQVTGMAKQMVTNFGFSDIGPWSLVSPGVMSQDVIMRMMAQNDVSEQLQEEIDRNVKRILDAAYEVAKAHIANNREAMDTISQRLTEVETMDGDAFRALLAEHATIPAKNLDAVEQLKAGILRAKDPVLLTASASIAIDLPSIPRS